MLGPITPKRMSIFNVLNAASSLLQLMKVYFFLAFSCGIQAHPELWEP